MKKTISAFHCKGHSLLEYLCCLMIISLIFHFSLSMRYNFNRFHHHKIVQASKDLFEEGRLLAQRYDRDHIILIENNKIILKNKNKIVNYIKVPYFIQAHINFRGYLGFKSNGNTKSPGTLSLEYKNRKKEIKLGVALAKWQVH